MRTVINHPPSLDERTFETVLEHLAPVPIDEKVLLDGRHTRWASPYGRSALRTVAHTRAEKPALVSPESEETGSYWARTGFFKHAEELFEMRGTAHRTRASGEADVLHEITAGAKSG